MARAAEQLAIPRTVISKAITDIEHVLGVRLSMAFIALS